MSGIGAVSSGRYDEKRARPVQLNVRKAIELMVCGREGDLDARPLDFVQAAAAVGMRAYVLRRHLEKPAARALLMATRRAYRDAICCGNEDALRRVRDNAANAMAQVAAIRLLEDLSAPSNARIGGHEPTPGVTIRMVTMVQAQPQQPLPVPQTIEIEALPVATVEHHVNQCSIRIEPPQPAPRRVDANGDPIFDPNPR
jgi:hypothetical protein